jgi:hypothetical protein
MSGRSRCALLQPLCGNVKGDLADLRQPLLRLRIGDARPVVPDLLGHIVLMAVVVQMFRTQFLGFTAREIDVVTRHLPGIAPRTRRAPSRGRGFEEAQLSD